MLLFLTSPFISTKLVTLLSTTRFSIAKFILSLFTLAVPLKVLFIEDDCCACTSILKDGMQIEINGIRVRYWIF